MSEYKILVADNDNDTLKICTEILSQAGYQVITASNPVEAQRILENERLHLAVLDLRLRNDADQHDRSGLLLAKNQARTLPKIIWTKFPIHEDVREALKPDSYDLPPAVDFVDQRKGYHELVAAIEESLNGYAKYNWDLEITWEANQTSGQLAQMIMPDVTIQNIPKRALEFEDLLRKLFFNSSQIIVDRLLFRDNNRVILPVYAYGRNGFLDEYIVSIGKSNVIETETNHYKTAVPQHIRTNKIGYQRSAKTTRFMASVFTFMGGRLANTALLNNHLARTSHTTLTEIIQNLYQENLSIWYRHNKTPKNRTQFLTFLEENFAYTISPHDIQNKIAAICEQAKRFGMVKITVDNDTLILEKGDKTNIAYHSPVSLLEKHDLFEKGFLEWGHIHGCVNLQTVLVNDANKTWLINFLEAKQGPLVYDFVTLEASLKYEAMSRYALQERLEIENELIQSADFFDCKNEFNLSNHSCRLLAAICAVRDMAKQFAGCEPQDYQLGLGFTTLKFLMSFEENQLYLERRLTPYIHAVISAGMLTTQLLNILQPTANMAHLPNIWVDFENKTVQVEGKPIELTIQEFQIMAFLYENQGKLCERKDIVEQGLGDIYDPFDVDQSRLNSAMSRLRHKIEPNPKKPKYLHTVRGRGYQLVVS